MLQNIIYVHYVPQLWKKKDFATAVLLCGYADNMLLSRQYDNCIRNDHTPDRDNALPDDEYFLYGEDTESALSEYYYHEYDVVESLPLSKTRSNNCNYYGNLSFQLMNSLSSSQLINVYRHMAANTPLYSYLKKYARTDEDYIFELVGTLAIREENYRRATAYLSKVSEEYCKSMNICSYLKRDPFYG